MARDKSTVRLWLRIESPNRDGSANIQLIYQIKGKRRYFSIPRIKLFPCNWSVTDQVAVYVDKKRAAQLMESFHKSKPDYPAVNLSLLPTVAEIKEVNTSLQHFAAIVSSIETRFRLDGIQFTPEMIIDSLKEKYMPSAVAGDDKNSVAAFIDEACKGWESTLKPGTLKVYSGLANHIRAFEAKAKKSVTLENIDRMILDRLYTFLIQDQSMGNITAAKQMSTLKTILNKALELKKQVNTDFEKFRISRGDGDLEVISLSQDEFQHIYSLDLSANRRLDAVRDVFCFSCATGLRYSDLAQLKREHIQKDNTIRITVSKTGKPLLIHLNPISYTILQKYSDKVRPLPVISNQKTNAYLKEIGKLAGIDSTIEKVRRHGVKEVKRIYKKYELLSIHVGRKSFVTLSLERGMPAHEVMGFSGHSTYKAFKRYVDITEKRKRDSMASAWGSLEPTPLKAVK